MDFKVLVIIIKYGVNLIYTGTEQNDEILRVSAVAPQEVPINLSTMLFQLFNLEVIFIRQYLI